MKHIPIEEVISKEKISNLVKLADYLEKKDLKIGFSMRQFKNVCGTVGCSVGHGPFAGIDKYPFESYTEYAERCFVEADIFDGGNLFRLLFCSFWSEYDDTPEGAARRIRYVIKHGVPTNSITYIQFQELVENAEL